MTEVCIFEGFLCLQCVIYNKREKSTDLIKPFVSCLGKRERERKKDK